MENGKKKTIADLMGSTLSEEKDMELAVKQIHDQAQKKIREKTVRVTVDTPESLHKSLKKIIIDHSMDLKTFFLEAVQEKYERMKD